MIINITGAPGAGKTYLSIKLLLDKYFDWDRKNKSWVRKPECEKYAIFTNINELKLDTKDLSAIFKERSFDYFFSYQYQEHMHTKYPNVVYVIDEVHDFMPPFYKNVDVIKYFSKHRHFGDHVFIVTQDYTMICKTINKLCELEYRAVKASFTVFGRFHYNVKSNGEIFKKISAKKDHRIFNVYKSFDGEDQQKTSNPIKYLIVVGFFVFFALAYLTRQMILPDKPVSGSQQQQDSQQQDSLNLNKTYFVDEKRQIESSPPVPPQEDKIDRDKIRAVEIVNVVTRGDKLFSFVCPFTEELYFAPDSPLYYKVKKFSGRFYAILTFNQYDELIQETTILRSITSTGSPDHDSSSRFYSRSSR